MRNRFFVGEQPEKAILSIVVVDQVPVPDSSHQKLFELQEVSDLLFIIREKNIVARKFGSLYRACCWVEAEGGLAETLMEALEYDKEIFGSHVLVMVTKVSNMTELNGQDLQKIAASSISKPIFETRKLTSQEFFDIYRDDRVESWINKYLFIPLSSPDLSDLYTTHQVISKETIIRPTTIGRMIEFWKSIKDDGFTGEGYVCSFNRQLSLDFFLASILKRLKQGELNIGLNGIL